jgi:hypothetical protein
MGMVGMSVSNFHQVFCFEIFVSFFRYHLKLDIAMQEKKTVFFVVQ